MKEQLGGVIGPTHQKVRFENSIFLLDKEKITFFEINPSLTGAASRWYIQLDRSHIRKWKDLALAFLKQYKHNIDMAPDRMDLQNMGKKGASSGNQQKGSQKQARTKPFHFPRTMSSGQSA